MGLDMSLIKYNKKYTAWTRPMARTIINKLTLDDLSKIREELFKYKGDLETKYIMEIHDGNKYLFTGKDSNTFLIDRIEQNINTEWDMDKDDVYKYDFTKNELIYQYMIQQKFEELIPDRNKPIKLNGVEYANLSKMIEECYLDLLGDSILAIEEYGMEVLDSIDTCREFVEEFLKFTRYKFDMDLLTDEEKSFARMEQHIDWGGSNDSLIYHNHILLTKYKIMERLEVKLLKEYSNFGNSFKTFLESTIKSGRDIMAG